MENNGWRTKDDIVAMLGLCILSGIIGAVIGVTYVSYEFHGQAIENNFARWEVINNCTGETTFKWNVQTNNVEGK